VTGCGHEDPELSQVTAEIPGQDVTLADLLHLLMDVRDRLARVEVELSGHRKLQEGRTAARDDRCAANETRLRELQLGVEHQRGAALGGRRVVGLIVAIVSTAAGVVGVIVAIVQ
jgi:hypothetical protein